MDIQTAKEEIKNTILAYLEKDEFGEYKIIRERQRPVFLLGAPGIGKTAIMEQIAKEVDINLVSYSITHHTRQSALGLPFIVQRTFSGNDTKITEYTMSEIIASVYQAIESSGNPNGILFIDEINSASETLAPTMLQFLQSKMFGTHRVPDGWIIIAAGNPPEYNKSVKEFDIVTLDRVKKMEIEPDFNVWKSYAYLRCIHISILNYLELFQKNFYFAENTVDGMRIVTPRGWEDLSLIMQQYESLKLNISENLVVQYIQHPDVSKEFFRYYLLFLKYRNDYDIKGILSDTVDFTKYSGLKSSKMDERIAVIGTLTEALFNEFYTNYIQSQTMKKLVTILRQYKSEINFKYDSEINQQFVEKHKDILKKAIENSLAHDKVIAQSTLKDLLEIFNIIQNDDGKTEAFKKVKSEFDKRVDKFVSESKKVNKWLSNSLEFIQETFGEKNELFIFVTEITLNPFSIKFLNENRNEDYLKYSALLLIGDQNKRIMADIESLELSEINDVSNLN